MKNLFIQARLTWCVSVMALDRLLNKPTGFADCFLYALTLYFNEGGRERAGGIENAKRRAGL